MVVLAPSSKTLFFIFNVHTSIYGLIRLDLVIKSLNQLSSIQRFEG